jgi:hypothetical protein
VPLVPIGGPEHDLFFDDEASTQALIDFRRFVIGFIEKYEPDTPRSGSGSATSSSDPGCPPSL